MAVDTRKREGQQLLLRFPEGSDLRDRLDECARANSRSLTGEIIHRLENSLLFPESSEKKAPVILSSGQDYEHLAAKLRALEMRVSQLEENRPF